MCSDLKSSVLKDGRRQKKKTAKLGVKWRESEDSENVRKIKGQGQDHAQNWPLTLHFFVHIMRAKFQDVLKWFEAYQAPICGSSYDARLLKGQGHRSVSLLEAISQIQASYNN